MHALARTFVATLAIFPASSALAQSPAPPAPQPPACETAQHRQFDFWVGRWDVYPSGTDQLVAHSLIERLYGGCAIRENWMPLQGTGGGSLNSWRPAEGRWRQLWTDSVNSYTEYVGGLEGEAMVLTATGTMPDGRPALIRMTYRRGQDGSVRQIGARSSDGGQTWEPRYDFTYRPARER